MLGVFADHHYFAFSLDDLALFTNFLYGRLNFHLISSILGIKLQTPDDTTASGVIDADLYQDLISRNDSDIVLLHLTRNVSENHHIVGKFYFACGVRKRLNDGSLKLHYIVFCQNDPSLTLAHYSSVRISAPSAVTATVFS